VRRRARAAGGALAAEPGIAVMCIAAALVYAVYAVVRYDHFETGFDLGIFTQAIWHASRLETPGSTIKGIDNLLGDHFHPIILLLAPVFRIWSDPRTLLVSQAVLVAASIVPVYLFARPRLGRGGAHLLALAYATFWGLAAGAGYEFHEVAFAPLLIALTLLFADRRRWTAYFVCIALVLCIKEDLSLLVCFFGLYLMTKGERRRGLITLAAGVAWYLLATRVFIPHFADGRAFTYWSYPDFGDNLGDALLHVLGNPLKPFDVGLDRPEKVHTLLYLFLPFLGLTLFSREALLAIPLLAERFLSAMPQFWATSFHYSLAIAPVLAMGASAGLANVAGLAVPAVRGRLKLAGAAAMVAAGFAVTWFAVPGAPIHRMVHAEFWRAPPYTAGIEGALAHVPRRGFVLAPDALVAHLAMRPHTFELARQSGNVEYILAGIITPVGSNSPDGRATFRQLQNNVTTRLLLYEPIFYRDGWVVLKLRPGGGNSGGNGVMKPLPRLPAQRISVLHEHWQAAFGRVNRQLSACGSRVGADPAHAPACFAAIGPEFGQVQAALDAELARALPTATGGCRQLGDLARFGAAQTARDVTNLRAAGGDPHSRRFDRAVRSYTADVNHFDLPGRLTRFVVLCYPRPLIVAPPRTK
jgi:uncharacterized membrane protein